MTRSNDNAERRSPPSDPPPSAFGRYEVLFPIDRGGMAEVLACRIRGEGHFERYFAVKRMAKEMIRHEKFVQSFLDEARLTGSIHSPNVVQVVDLGRDDRGAPFLVMELVKGVSLSTLRKRLGAELLPLGAVVEIGSQAASGLEDAHTATDVRGESLGIVHRDISPQNILLGIDGRVRIADFGIARAKQRLAQTTQSGELKGKFAYFAPEQLRSESDPRTDVFALGVVLWELIAGRALFYKPEVLETIMNVERMPIPRLDTIRQDVPEALASLIARVLERDLEARCPSAGVLSNELRELLDRGVVAQTPQAELRKIAYRGAESLLQRLQEAAGPAPDAGRESLGESFVSTSTGTGPERLEPASVQPVTVQGPRPKAIERTTVRDLSNEIAGEVSTRVVVAAPSLVHASDAAEAAPAITVPGRVEVTDDLGTTWKTPGPQPHLDDGAREDAAIVAELEDASAIRTARGVDPRRENARDTARDLDPVPPISTLQPPVRVSAPIEARVVPVLSAPDTPARRPAMLWVAGATLGLLGVAAVVAIAPWSSSPPTPTSIPSTPPSIAAPSAGAEPAQPETVRAEPAAPVPTPETEPASIEAAPTLAPDAEGSAAHVHAPSTTGRRSPTRTASSESPAVAGSSAAVPPRTTQPAATAVSEPAPAEETTPEPPAEPTRQRPRVYGVGALDGFDDE